MVHKSERLSRSGSRLLIAVVMLAAVTVASPSIARADTFGATNEASCGFSVGTSGWQQLTNCVSMANNRWHAVHYGVVGNQWDGIDDATTWSLANHYDPLDRLVAYVDQNDPLPDVIVYDHDIYGDNNLAGWVDCPANNTGTGGTGADRWCRGQILRYNAFYEDVWVDTNAARRGLACHEMGHTLGLRHDPNSSNGCMRTNPRQNSSGDYYYQNWLLNHDEAHIEDAY